MNFRLACRSQKLRLRPPLLGLVLGLSALSLNRPVGATIVERVVAVVGEHPLLLSELRSRTKPFEAQLGAGGTDHAARRSQLFSEMLDRMVDEELLRRAASQAKVTVTSEEVEAAIERVAAGNNVTAEELMTEVERSGVTASQYRRELRGQLLDAKVMNTRMQGRVSVSPEEVNEEYRQLVIEERQTLPVRLSVIRLQVPNGAGTEGKVQLQAQAKELSARAQSGDSFAELSKQHSTDPVDRQTGGALPEVTPGQMPRELATAVLTIEPGQVTSPIWSDGTWVILKLESRGPSRLPSFEEAEMQLAQRVQMRKMEVARRRWLDDMRKRTHVEIRL